MVNNWSQTDSKSCPCGGSGWAQMNSMGWQECSIHFFGQIHPETYRLLLDEPSRLEEEKRRASLMFEIRVSRELLEKLKHETKLEQENLLKLERDLVNKTPTIRAIPAVRITENKHG